MACLNITILFRNKHIADILWNVSLHIHSLIPCLDLLMVNSIGFIIEVRNEFHDKIKIHGSGNEAMDDTKRYNFINIGIAMLIKFLRVADGFLFIFSGSIVGKNNSTQHIEISMNSHHRNFRCALIKRKLEPSICNRKYVPISRSIHVCKFPHLEFVNIFIHITRCLIAHILINAAICKKRAEANFRFRILPIFRAQSVHRFPKFFFIDNDPIFLVKLNNVFRDFTIFSCSHNKYISFYS